MVHCTKLGTSYQIIWYIEPKRTGAYRNEPTPFVPNFKDLANRVPVSRSHTRTNRVPCDYGREIKRRERDKRNITSIIIKHTLHS